MSCIYNLGLLLNTSCVFTNLLRPRPHVSGPFWIRNFCFRPHVSSESCRRIRNFLNLLSRIRYESGIVWTLVRIFFHPVTEQERAQFFTVKGKAKFERFMTHALLPISPEESWILEWIRIRVGYVWKGKFGLNMDTRGRGNFWNRKENLRALARDKCVEETQC